jgi:hypothetical protein
MPSRVWRRAKGTIRRRVFNYDRRNGPMAGGKFQRALLIAGKTYRKNLDIPSRRWRCCDGRAGRQGIHRTSERSPEVHSMREDESLELVLVLPEPTRIAVDVGRSLLPDLAATEKLRCSRAAH